MSWFKVDDKLHSSQKLLRIPRRYRLAALGLWTLSGSWSADQLTDGKIPEYMVEEWGATKTLVDWLVKVDLWIPTDDGTQFKNWDEYQPTKADVEKDRAKNREKLRKWRERNQDTNRDVTGLQGGYEPNSNPAPVPTRPDPSLKEEANASSSGEAKRPTKLPKDWAPSAAHLKTAKDKGIDIMDEAENFRLHAETHGRTAVSWNGAFSTWLKKSKPSTRQPAAASPWSKDFHK